MAVVRTYGPQRIETICPYKIQKVEYPYCYAYNFNLNDDINQWLKDNGIDKFLLYMEGDDMYSHESIDTISFANEIDATAFKMRFQ